MNPLPLIERALQLPKGSKGICQGFEVSKFFGLAIFHVRVGLILIHDGLSSSVRGSSWCLRKLMPGPAGSRTSDRDRSDDGQHGANDLSRPGERTVEFRRVLREGGHVAASINTKPESPFAFQEAWLRRRAMNCVTLRLDEHVSA